MKSTHFRKAFTLIELLVVISIIGMLSSVVLASLGTARDKALLSRGITFETHLSRAWTANDTVAQFTFDDSAYTDTSGYSQVTLSTTGFGSPTFPDGIKGKAVLALSAYLKYNNSFFTGRTSIGSNGSASFYINPSTSASARSILNIRGLNIQITANTNFITFNGVTSSKSVVSGKWSHVLVSWGTENGTPSTRIYINGDLAGNNGNLPSFTSDYFGILTDNYTLDNVSIYTKSIQSPQ